MPLDKCHPIPDDRDVPYAVVVTGKESTPGLEKKLFDAWQPFLAKIQEVHVIRARKGGSSKAEGDRMLRCIKGRYDAAADGDAAAYLRGLVSAAIDLAQNDAGDKRGRYGFAIAGLTISGFEKAQWLTDVIEDWIEVEGSEPATRESELLATIKQLREWGNDCARHHLAAMGAGTQLAEGVVRIAEATAGARGAADAAYWNAQTNLSQQSNQLSIDLAQINAQTRKADRGYDTLLAVAKMFAGDMSGLFEDLISRPTDASGSASASASSSSSSPPSSGPSTSSAGEAAPPPNQSTDPADNERKYGGASLNEIRRILSGRPDVLELFVRRRGLTGLEYERATAELRQVWVSLPKNQAFAIARLTITVLGAGRAIPFSKWIRADFGITT